jgi:sec-independent protein translocase protein TatA
MGALKPWHIIVLVVVLMLLFGAKRMPDAARGLGRSLRIFKSEVKEMQKDDDVDEPAAPINAKVVRRDVDGTVHGTVNGHVSGTHDGEPSSVTRDR